MEWKIEIYHVGEALSVHVEVLFIVLNILIISWVYLACFEFLHDVHQFVHRPRIYIGSLFYIDMSDLISLIYWNTMPF